jgi:hypothetical protein
VKARQQQAVRLKFTDHEWVRGMTGKLMNLVVRFALPVALIISAALAHGQETKDRRPKFQSTEYGVQTQVFGIRAKGTRFVYVFDRSGSMSDYEGRPLAAAKRELIASLRTLKAVNQFQIIFFNENPRMLNLAPGQSPQMVFADEQGQRLAVSFVEGITAEGATDRLLALRMALRMQPDVIFFLSDADRPGLTSADLQSLARINAGTAIHAIEFGVGPATEAPNFLHRLAAENAGQHAYVDVTSLPK